MSHSFVEPRAKVIMIMIIMGHEYIWGTTGVSVGGEGKGKDTEG
jgi:hypothetical protein